MKILYILPDSTIKTGGNWITASRLKASLEKRDFNVDIMSVKDVRKEHIVLYDIIHSFHIFKSFEKISHLLIGTNKTIIVSFTGTDIKQLKEMRKNKDKIIDLLNKTDRIVVFHNEARDELIEEGLIKEKIKTIAQTPMLEADIYDQNVLSIETFMESSYINFLFASGIRKVKNPLEMIEMMSALVKKVENIRLIIIGAILEEDLGKQVKEKIKGKEWTRYLGEVSHKDTQIFISKADIVINTSLSEGMPNTLLEAKYLGKAILASNIAGNRAIVKHGENGFLFTNKQDFQYYGKILAENPNIRRKMKVSNLKAKTKYNISQEINLYEEIYGKRKIK